jgi:hypothetical protein
MPPATKADQPRFLVAQVHPRLGGEIPLPHFEVSSFLAAAIGLLGFVSLSLLVFGRLGIGSIVAFLVAGLLVGMIRDLPGESVLALREFAELGVILLLFLIGTPEDARPFYAPLHTRGCVFIKGCGADSIIWPSELDGDAIEFARQELLETYPRPRRPSPHNVHPHRAGCAATVQQSRMRGPAIGRSRAKQDALTSALSPP